MKSAICSLLLTLFLAAPLLGHDTYEITLELKEGRKTVQARLELARSTSVAACDPAPSQGVYFEPAEFPKWKPKLEAAASEFIAILGEEGSLAIESFAVSLNREDDILIDYAFQANGLSLEKLHAPILSRFPPEGFGVRVTYRDKSGYWYPPFMIFEDRQTVELPTR
ncbi:hypothetical protein [Pelagicoccus sp. SDUM812003]|uniref:hypothetical protein n=1 Tax=Pelagicoccus sp. SDUM812003 TaxID=3041267 RepID=UPI0028106DCA|nr:hypothetical protein [Pelagicoccus sp. SDUM812003]MDQ8204956.1 hypothetical protein [Pelagicoccus sp. SDUM812003]